MQLFILIGLMCLINTILPDFIRNYLKISRFWKSTTNAAAQMQQELDAAREELDNVHSAQHSGEYARKIKTMRAERKVADVEAKIQMSKKMEVLKQSSIDTVAYYASKVLFSFIVVIVCARNRNSAVMIFDDSFNLAPLGGLLSFPTGIYNAISVPAWAFSCNFTFSLLYGLVKK
ncbi:guided entry of tail-anchored proteins factor 1 [Drosophila albomicans]|uniref:Guided entry of tail-anchored proteins factor 1 n=1 Tax=Drosophila albomicans TaxID=7291 RepID=A0A6P8WWA7_DROAB|nr:guided entry of tail-anchored proteins factor 1 [Drosophila albomicans]